MANDAEIHRQIILHLQGIPLLKQQKIRVIPTFQVFKEGKTVDTFRGGFSKLELLAQLSNVIVSDEPRDAPAEEGEGASEEASEDTGDNSAEEAAADNQEA